MTRSPWFEMAVEEIRRGVAQCSCGMSGELDGEPAHTRECATIRGIEEAMVQVEARFPHMLKNQIQLERVFDAAYVEDCHISGTHDPTHVHRYVCESQLAWLARRVTAVLFGVDWEVPKGESRTADKEVNKIPRRLTSYWYNYFKEQDPDHPKALELERWQDQGMSREGS